HTGTRPVNDPCTQGYLSLSFGQMSGGDRVNLTRSQFAAAIQADEKWVENTARALGLELTYTPSEARRMGLVRLLTRDFGISAASAAELADQALRHPPDARAVSLAPAAESPATLL